VEHTHGNPNHPCPCNPANKPTASPLNKCPTLKRHLYPTKIKKKKKELKNKKRINFRILISGAMNAFRSLSSTSISSSLSGIKSEGPTKSAIEKKK
jgi:hypothetical protein